MGLVISRSAGDSANRKSGFTVYVPSSNGERDIYIEVISVSGNQVKILIEADKDIDVVRDDIIKTKP